MLFAICVFCVLSRVRLSEESAAAASSRKHLEEEKSSLEKGMARLEARFEASLQQLKDREEVSRMGSAVQCGAERVWVRFDWIGLYGVRCGVMVK